eukprot:CAMPEP_0173450696 /NCGR_PEP_ID=MMETSP1357-20121228/45289_1 /TAXON_ID=77926 /ORGANISM="Hemiselmis rufescens, Strain PCC563" /LENGTH=89 /DNA_ID=CAMNT_0014417401 /DNA_START=162 /DNA_END=428 /DNA_ORIENTATION=+
MTPSSEGSSARPHAPQHIEGSCEAPSAAYHHTASPHFPLDFSHSPSTNQTLPPSTSLASAILLPDAPPSPDALLKEQRTSDAPPWQPAG